MDHHQTQMDHVDRLGDMDHVDDEDRVDHANDVGSAPPPAHWLLTSPGVKLNEVTYSLGGKQVSASLAPVALLELLPGPRRPQQVLALVTSQAKKDTLGYLEAEAVCPVTPISIPDGKSPDEIWEILSRILAAVPPGIRLTLDVTHGFRSLPFVYFTAALFLTTLRNVAIEGVYYGMFEGGGEGDPKPFVDLAVVLRLAEWFYATRVFRETGQADDLVRLFDTGAAQGRAAKKLVAALAEFSRSYASGLPLEAGLAAAEACWLGRDGGSLNPTLHVPAGEELLQAMVRAVEPFQLADVAQTENVSVSRNVNRAKAGIAGDLGELRREARLIDLYLERGQFGVAVQLVREWMVNRVLVAEGRGTAAGKYGWLDYRPYRALAEKRLNGLALIPPGLLTAQQRMLNAWWQRLSTARNEVAHCGFRPQMVDVAKKLADVRQVWQQVRFHLEDESFWQLQLNAAAGDGLLLVSPVGRTRGALFTAIKKVQPRWLLPIVSQDTAPSVGEIVAAAGFTGETLPPLIMNDPFTGFAEIPHLVEDKDKNRAVAAELAKELLHGSEVVVNLAGGTTVMQQLAQKVADAAARKLGLRTRTMAVVDRRSRQEQEENPYVEGELVWLSDDGDDNGA